jgi:hypothetical protein
MKGHKIEPYPKTDAGIRNIDLHPDLAGLVNEYIGTRKNGFLFEATGGTRGRPPCGFGIEAERSGRIKLHSASGTSAAAMTIPPSREGQTLGLYRGRFCYRHLGNPVTSDWLRNLRGG